ncbi:DUF3488 and transglutaminase-like domain-containing protein [Nocardiopsis sp. RSe5-2]|uniref:DUF3488 and transglutaminase-like domain-containing protein n=1 Tax=Nocardiopsis endophytica TaxID=3018445 RepID=A0ABT4UDA3_9ACTN|nr:DUF3488 and transglutaminase-like domain-containing protein [Nocardiopsis endophytica]MDA2814979.1 DUF3488 and transglutaminase-like domain-containing protein [Nocardiopsis endophytica]
MRAAVLTLVAAAAVLCSLPLLASLFSGPGWAGAAVTVVVLMALAGAVLRAVPRAAPAAPPAQVLVAVLALSALAAPREAFLGLFPTGGTIERAVEMFAQGRAEIDASPPPIDGTPAMALIVAVGVALVALIADLFTVVARTPAMVGLPVASFAAIPLTVDDSGVGAGAFALAAGGYVALLAADGLLRGGEGPPGSPVAAGGPSRAAGAAGHTVAGVGAAAGALVLALLVPLAVPGLADGQVHRLADPSRFGQEVVTTQHPLVSLRRDLASRSDSVVLEYTTTEDSPAYLRTYALDAFDGTDWTMEPVHTEDGAVVDGELPRPPGLSTALSPREVDTEVRLEQAPREAGFLPLPYPARGVDIGGEWYADPESLMVYSIEDQDVGARYTVTSLAPPAPAEVAERGAAPRVDGRFTEVPGGVDPRVAELAASETEGAEGPLAQAVALQEWFTSQNRFTYSLDPPEVPEGGDPLASFLFEDRVGYCEQFAAAMAVMARTLDIPARVAVGYTSGRQVGGDRWEVRESDAHAWPELYFEGVGWLRFEPTPSSGGGQGSATVPGYAAPEALEEPDEPGAAPSPDRPEEETPEPDSPEETEEPEDEEEPQAGGAAEPEDPQGGAGVPEWSGTAAAAAGAVAGALVLLLVPAAVRTVVRRSRVARAGGGSAEAAAAAWREVRALAVDLGLRWTPAESPRAAAGRLGEECGLAEADAEALRRLALAEEAARYAPSPAAAPPGALVADLRRASAAMRRSRGRGTRARAVLLPRSLMESGAARGKPEAAATA